MKKLFLVVVLCLNYSAFAEEGSSSSERSKEHFGILGYDLLVAGNFEDGSSTGSSTSFDTELEFETGMAIGYEYRETKQHDWGFGIGILHHTKRDVDKLEQAGVTYTVEDPASISVTRIFGNAIYRWESFYIPFGMNLASNNFKQSSSATGSTDSKLGLGFNFAIGWYLNEKFNIEYGAYSNIWKLEGTASNGNKTDYGDGTLSYSTLKLMYRFN